MTFHKKNSYWGSHVLQVWLCNSPHSVVSLFTMGNHRISDDLKEAVLCLQDDGYSSAYVKQITGGISESMLYHA
jgi:hypothetical protein